MSRLDDVKKLLGNNQRRLQALQERKALYGLEGRRKTRGTECG